MQHRQKALLSFPFSYKLRRQIRSSNVFARRYLDHRSHAHVLDVPVIFALQREVAFEFRWTGWTPT